MDNRRPGPLSAIVLTLLFLVVACGGDETPTAIPGCEDAPRPIVFVHGFMGGGDNFANTALRFASNGYCPEYLRVYDWNTLSFDIAGHAAALADFVDGVLEETGADQVDLVGHSMGGRLGHQYLQEHADRVAHYVHAASSCNLEFPDTVPLLVLSSDEDTVAGLCDLEGADNQDVDGADHLQIVTLPQVFATLYRFFNDGQEPATTRVVTEETVALSGKVLTFGMNLPLSGAVVAVYALDAATGERLTAAPQASFTTGADGTWGPFQADPAAYYEFEVSATGLRPFHYYRQPFARSNSLIYLRVLPASNLLLDRVLGDIRYDDGSSNVVFFSANQALYHGRDTATLDGIELVTPAMAPPPPAAATTIVIFVFDANGNGRTDGGPIPIQIPELPLLEPVASQDGGQDSDQPSELPFVRQYDAFLDAGTRRTLTLTMNGATLHVPTWKGDSQGVIIVVFD